MFWHRFNELRRLGFAPLEIAREIMEEEGGTFTKMELLRLQTHGHLEVLEYLAKCWAHRLGPPERSLGARPEMPGYRLLVECFGLEPIGSGATFYPFQQAVDIICRDMLAPGEDTEAKVRVRWGIHASCVAPSDVLFVHAGLVAALRTRHDGP